MPLAEVIEAFAEFFNTTQTMIDTKQVSLDKGWGAWTGAIVGRIDLL